MDGEEDFDHVYLEAIRPMYSKLSEAQGHSSIIISSGIPFDISQLKRHPFPGAGLDRGRGES